MVGTYYAATDCSARLRGQGAVSPLYSGIGTYIGARGDNSVAFFVAKTEGATVLAVRKNKVCRPIVGPKMIFLCCLIGQALMSGVAFAACGSPVELSIKSPRETGVSSLLVDCVSGATSTATNLAHDDWPRAIFKKPPNSNWGDLHGEGKDPLSFNHSAHRLVDDGCSVCHHKESEDTGCSDGDGCHRENDSVAPSRQSVLNAICLPCHVKQRFRAHCSDLYPTQ